MKGTSTQREAFELGTHMIDLRSPRYVEVDIQYGRLYIHVDGVTVLRIYEVTDLKVVDDR